MARRKKEMQTKEDMRKARLELIKRRHRELILQARELVAVQMNDEYEDVLDDADIDELEMAEAISDRP